MRLLSHIWVVACAMTANDAEEEAAREAREVLAAVLGNDAGAGA
jgi:hypothetical protein